MHVRRFSFGYLAPAVLALGLVTPALAETIEMRVLPNTSADALTASLERDSSMNVFSFSNQSGTSTGVLTVLIRDERGTYAGWNVTLESSDFIHITDDVPAIPASGFTVASSAGIAAEVGATDGIDVVNTGVSLNTGPRIVQAVEGAGTGMYAQKLNVELEIPARQPRGEYRSDVTVTIASGPGEIDG